MRYCLKDIAALTGGTLTVKAVSGKVQVSHSSGGTLYTGSSVNIMRERIDKANTDARAKRVCN